MTHQPLASEVYAKVTTESPVKPAVWDCAKRGCFPDPTGPDPTRCTYCGEPS